MTAEATKELKKYGTLIDALADRSGALDSFLAESEKHAGGKSLVDWIRGLLFQHFGQRHKAKSPKQREVLLTQLRAKVIPKDLETVDGGKRMNPGRPLSPDEYSWLSSNLSGMLRAVGSWNEENLRDIVGEDAADNQVDISALEKRVEELKKELAEASDPYKGDHSEHIQPLNLKALRGTVRRDLEDTILSGGAGGAKGGTDSEVDELVSVLDHNYSVVSDKISKAAPGSISEDEIDSYSFAAAQYIMRTPGTAQYGRKVDTNTDSGAELTEAMVSVHASAEKVARGLADGSFAMEDLKMVRDWAAKVAPHYEGKTVGTRNESFVQFVSGVLRALAAKVKAGAYAEGLAPLREELHRELFSPLAVGASGIPKYSNYETDALAGMPMTASSVVANIISGLRKSARPWFLVAQDKDYLLTVQDVLKSKKMLEQALSESAKRGAKDSSVLQKALKDLRSVTDSAMSGEYAKNRAELQRRLSTIKSEAAIGDDFFEHFADSPEKATSRYLQGLVRTQLTLIMKARGEHSDKRDTQANLHRLNMELAKTIGDLNEARSASEVKVPGYATKHGVWGKKVALPKEYRDKALEALNRNLPEKEDISKGHTEKLNPFAGGAADDYVSGLLSNLFRGTGAKDTITHLDYQELETYLSKFWEGLFSFVEDFEGNFKKYRAGLEAALAKNPYVVPDVDDIVKAYSKDLEGRVANVVSAAAQMKGGASDPKAAEGVIDMAKKMVADSLNDFSHDSGRFTGNSKDSLSDSVKSAVETLSGDFYDHMRSDLESSLRSGDGEKADKSYGKLRESLIAGLQRQDGGHKHKADIVARAAIGKYLDGEGLEYEPAALRAVQDDRVKGASRDSIELAEDLVQDATKKAMEDTLPSSAELGEAGNVLSSDSEVGSSLEAVKAAVSKAASFGEKALHWVDYKKSAGDIVASLYSDVMDANNKLKALREEDLPREQLEEKVAAETSRLSAGLTATMTEALGKEIYSHLIGGVGKVLDIKLPQLRDVLPALEDMLKVRMGEASLREDPLSSFDPDKNAATVLKTIENHLATLIQRARLLASADGWDERYLLALKGIVASELAPLRGEATFKKLGDLVNSKIEKAIATEPFSRDFKSKVGTLISEDTKVRAYLSSVAGALAEGNQEKISDLVGKGLETTAAEAAAKHHLGLAPVLATIASLVPTSPTSNSTVTMAVKSFRKGVADMRTTVRSQLLPKSSVKDTLSDMAEDGGGIKDLFKSQSKPYTGKLYPVEYHDEGSLNYLKGYLKRVVDQDYFSDLLSGRRRDMDTSKSQVLPMAKLAAYGGFNSRDLTGQNLADVVMGDLDAAYDSITSNPVFVLVESIISKYGSKPSYQDFFREVQDANTKGAGITKDSFKKLVASVDAMLGVERLYETEARGVASRFEKAILGIYKYLDKDNVLREITRRQSKGGR